MSPFKLNRSGDEVKGERNSSQFSSNFNYELSPTFHWVTSHHNSQKGKGQLPPSHYLRWGQNVQTPYHTTHIHRLTGLKATGDDRLTTQDNSVKAEPTLQFYMKQQKHVQLVQTCGKKK